jgi:hypothetical protein
MWQSPQVVLKNSVDRMHMVEDAKHDRGILGGQLVEIPASYFIEAAIGPSLHGNELNVRLTEHERCPSMIAIGATNPLC